jgi:uncharacterized protein (DUF2147 family)
MQRFARPARVLALAAAATVLSASAASATDGSSGAMGVWRNPKNSVHVKIEPCGSAMCGTVVWASPKAQADAKKGGTDRLVGLQLLRNFTPVKPGVWRGKVFVPDLNGTFSGTAELVDAGTLKARGCLFVGFACKTQLWKKVDNAAD